MQKRISQAVFLLLFVTVQMIFAATILVSKDGTGMFTTVQEAVNAAVPGDIIEITDQSVYQEQVTISTNNIILKSSNPKSPRKPVIQWRDIVNVGPKSQAEAQIPELITFDQNGALRVMDARKITIEGITVDGGSPFYFGYTGVWGASPLFHGNAAITLWLAGDVIIRNCELINAFFGVNVKDRNEGGIFANANPQDIQPWLVVPLSGFGKTGNHIFEYNRIHNNSFGMFFESVWDLGSVIRYNLIYENHHTTAMGPDVKRTPGGDTYPGGAFMFKDHLLSPLAIYNNTFWHNYIIFAGHWRAGAQHLIFNNLYAKPFMYWSDYATFSDFQALDKNFIHRMHNCLYTAQVDTPQYQTQTFNGGYTYSWPNTVRIMNGLDQLQRTTLDILLPDGTTQTITNAIQPGALITGTQAGSAFTVAANVRWLEIVFQSTDPDDAMFLTPDWGDPLMVKYIVDQGWPEAGIYDADGTIADIGAIPYNTIPSQTRASIKPLDAVTIDGTTATVPFRFDLLEGTLSNPKVKYVKWINNVVFDPDAFGGNTTPIELADIRDVTLNPSSFVFGSNRISFSVPSRTATQAYAFLELVIEGTDASGNLVSSNVGFLPYRQLEYQFIIEIWDLAGTQRLTSVTAGEQVKMRIIPVRVGSTDAITATIDTVAIDLVSGYDLLDKNGSVYSITGGFSNTFVDTVIFTKVPTGIGEEFVSARGKFLQSGDAIPKAIGGSSNPITILPGPPVDLEFIDPVSNSRGLPPPLVNPGVPYPVQIQVYDQYLNKVGAGAAVSVLSLEPLIGNVTGPASASTDSAGVAHFGADVTGGDLDDVFRLEGTLSATGAKDTASLKVGQARTKLWIFYNDFLNLDETAELRGNVGERYPITIVASPDGIVVDTLVAKAIEIQPSTGHPLRFYASQTDAVPLDSFNLVAGQVTVWVTATARVNDGAVNVSPFDNSYSLATRDNIFFEQIPLEIFYNDYLNYSSAAELRGIAGTRLLITIVATVDGITVNTASNNIVGIRPVQNIPLQFYTSETDDTPDSVFTLVNGEVQVWVNGRGRVDDGTIEVRALDSILQSRTRGNIYFTQMPLKIFYDDLGAYNLQLERRGYIGMKYPVQIATSIDGSVIDTGYNNEIQLSASLPFQFYSSAVETVPSTTFTLSAGQVTVWVSADILIENGIIQVISTDSLLQMDSRNKVYFDPVPLVILYADTIAYDPNTEIRGSAGERFPVTFRASIDGTTPVGTYGSLLTITSNLKVFASSDIADEVEISSINLVNGEAVVWVTSYTTIANAYITVTPAGDLSLVQGSRDKIYFTKSAFTIERAVGSANNGFGMLDRVDLYYTTELTVAPDSVTVSWPTGGAQNTKTVSGAYVVLDAANPMHVTVTFPQPFPEAITTYTASNNLGQAYWSDPALAGSAPDICPFSIIDSIGPLLTSATLLQRFGPGNDILFVTFSENVSPQQLIGSSLLFISAAGEVPINVVDANIMNDTVLIEVAQSASYTLRALDSLRINPLGNAEDMYMNKAHINNRPVVIQLRLVPPEIDSAYYLDSYPDGFLDQVNIYFGAAVDISQTSMSFSFDGVSFPAVTSTNFQYLENDSSKIRVDLTGVFSSLGIKTYGTMNVQVTYGQFPGETRQSAVEDRAAPVIASAIYSPGNMLTEDVYAKDTVRITYSEEANVTGSDNPLLFNQVTANGIVNYSMTLEVLSRNSNQITFLVHSILDSIRPGSNDSVWINTSGATTIDRYGIVQLDPGNRRVKMKVNAIKMNINVRIGPNPFNPYTPIVISIDPSVKIADLVSISAEVVIYDAIGNVVHRAGPVVNTSGNTKIDFQWNGTNTRGRIVGTGTYLVIIKYTDLATGFRYPVSKSVIGFKK